MGKGRMREKMGSVVEISGVVSQVVRYLQPLLLPYEAAVYWHMFERAVLREGDRFCRVSTRGLMEGVVRSSSGKSDTLNYKTVSTVLRGLEERGAIQKVGEPNLKGTPYRVLLPEEIPECVSRMRVEAELEDGAVDVEVDLDYYNVRENRMVVFERDGYCCRYCGKQLTQKNATLDHVLAVSQGGENSFGNLVTACRGCNSRKGSSVHRLHR